MDGKRNPRTNNFFADKIRAAEQKDMENCLSAMIELGADEKDVVATLLNTDHETMHGALSNLWFHMVTSPEKLKKQNPAENAQARIPETLRHSPPSCQLRDSRYEKSRGWTTYS